MGAKLSAGGSKFSLGQNSDINVTPFVDVMLVLLIIFMVAAPLATVSIKVDLPPPSPNDAPPPDKLPVVINVETNGLFLGTTPTSIDTLIPDLTAALGSANPTDERISIRANRFVQYDQFMEVLNKLQFGGFIKIGLIAEDL